MATSESSFFVSPHRLILKTCGTTLNLLGLTRILEIAATYAQMPSVYRCFYSRKSFMFPERQNGPHRDWKDEVAYLDNIFKSGSAYTVGKVNGDHWLLYMTCPDETMPTPIPSDVPDYTIEILMSGLSPAARESFYPGDLSTSDSPSTHAQNLSSTIGISDFFPADLTTLDAYTFSPCGYSSNAIIRWGEDPSFASSIGTQPSTSEGYYTIHVTPEEGWSYASFECNVPLSTLPQGSEGRIPDLKSLIRRVIGVFQPARLTMTLFVSSEDNEAEMSVVEIAQKAFKAALTTQDAANPGKLYRRTDKINYEFGGYDLAFASFELL